MKNNISQNVVGNQNIPDLTKSAKNSKNTKTSDSKKKKCETSSLNVEYCPDNNTKFDILEKKLISDSQNSFCDFTVSDKSEFGLASSKLDFQKNVFNSLSTTNLKPKRRKSLKSIFKILLDTEITKSQLEKLNKGVCDFPIFENSIKVSQAIAISQVIKAIGGDMKAFELISDITGENSDKKSTSKGFKIIIEDM